MSGAPLVAGVPSAFFSPSLRSFFLFSSPLGDLFSLLSFFLSFSHLRGRAVQWVVESAVCEAARGAPPPSVIVGKGEGWISESLSTQGILALGLRIKYKILRPKQRK